MLNEVLDYYFVFDPVTQVMSEPLTYESVARDWARKQIEGHGSEKLLILHCIAVAERQVTTAYRSRIPESVTA